jgi:hypothetical protein
MIATRPRIGFDRFIDMEWLRLALRVRTGAADLTELSDALDTAGLGKAAKKKTQTVLNRLWLEPRPDLKEFANRAVALLTENPEISQTVWNWGMAIATYPFFGQVAELVGRLTSLQGDCASSEIH